MTVDPTDRAEYAKRLQTKSNIWWKKLLNVQAPYRWNLRRLAPGFTLDVGCGIGRNLVALDGVGVDHNAAAVESCRRQGLRAYLPDEFLRSGWARPSTFDSLLLAHVVEHMRQEEVAALLRTYVPFVKPEGALIMITPQERGFRTDSTHVEFVDFAGAGALQRAAGFEPVLCRSFPLPRAAGKLFPYNEFVVVGRRPAG
jgi:2-polyprenyl-3-methyl-5-hydroxy-6-metoxy-1,4-benzoquinol methylase